MVTIRPEREEDYARVARLLSMGYAEPVSEAQVREWRMNQPAGRISLRLVAEDAAGEVLGYAHALRDEWEGPVGWLHVAVDPEARRQGIGTRLYDHVAAFVQTHGSTQPRAEVRETLATDGMPFAERRGFHRKRHIFESALDLVAFDEAPFAANLAHVEGAGIRFRSLAELGDTAGARRKLHAFNEAVAMDIPGRDVPPRPYEAFAKQIFEATWFRPEGQIVSLDGETWIGLAAAGIFSETHSAYNLMTGVLPAYRGRGVAQALKVLAIRFAHRSGATLIRTNNDSENGPMLAVNRKLGYQPEPGYYVMARE